MKYKILGNTYNIRYTLSMLGCVYIVGNWYTDSNDLLIRLKKQGISEEVLRKIKLQKIEKNS